MSAASQLCFSRDDSVARIREHSGSLDRNKRFTALPRLTFNLGLSPIEWAVFSFYYSLAPTKHPGEQEAARRLRIGRNLLRQTLFKLRERGMVYFSKLKSNNLRIVHIAHPGHWMGSGVEKMVDTIDPSQHESVLHTVRPLPERSNEAKTWFASSMTLRLPYLLFQLSLSPLAKMLYALHCHIGVYDHPSPAELAATCGSSPSTVVRALSALVEANLMDFSVREQESFGQSRKYYYHTRAVSQWRCHKAKFWYPFEGKSALSDLGETGKLYMSYRQHDDNDDFSLSPRAISALGCAELSNITSDPPIITGGLP